MPGRHQDQHATGFRENGMALARACGHRLPDELPARPPDRDALFHAGDPEGISPDVARVGWASRPALPTGWRPFVNYRVGARSGVPGPGGANNAITTTARRSSSKERSES